ncbi:MAG: hypothetical protein JNM63_03720 [Spirochaetia bacterium]|nr:hypothetical protein [Spirochaetia bacterium]
MRNLIAFFFLAGFLASCSSGRPLAVLEFEGKGLSQSELSALSEACREDFKSRGGYRVLSSGRMAELLHQTPGCLASGCLSDVGAALKTEVLVTGLAEEAGGKIKLRIQITDLKSGRVETRTFFSEGTEAIAGLRSKISAAVKTLEPF